MENWDRILLNRSNSLDSICKRWQSKDVETVNDSYALLKWKTFCTFIYADDYHTFFCSRKPDSDDDWKCKLHINEYQSDVKNHIGKDIPVYRILFPNSFKDENHYIDLNTCQVFKDVNCNDSLGHIFVQDNFHYLF